MNFLRKLLNSDLVPLYALGFLVGWSVGEAVLGKWALAYCVLFPTAIGVFVIHIRSTYFDENE